MVLPKQMIHSDMLLKHAKDISYSPAKISLSEINIDLMESCINFENTTAGGKEGQSFFTES